ncbi:hypothetical protein [Deinococcus aerophilus]|nr:hypothetical protein [Deinococcus aerophilus]
MKKMIAPAMTVTLTALLAACGGGGGGPTPPASAHTLSIKLTGPTSAPVKVINSTIQATLFEGTLASGKAFAGIAAGNVLRVEGGPVNGYTTPPAQSVTLDADKTVTLEYKVSAPAGVALSNTTISGKVSGTDLKLNNAYIESARTVFFAKSTLADNVLSFDLSKIAPEAADLTGNFDAGCTARSSDSTARVLESIYLNTYSPQRDLLGTIKEKVVAGADASLPDALIDRLYSDRPFTMKSTCSFTNDAGIAFSVKYDIAVGRGWNTLVLSKDGTTYTVRNASSDDQVGLVFTSSTPRVGVDFNSQDLTFTSNETVTVDADLVQIGNYSGTVNLSTSIPGLTVEPATVTLAPLPKMTAQAAHSDMFGGLDLQPQLLATKLTFRYTGTDNYTGQPFEVMVKDGTGKQVGTGFGVLNVNRPGISMYIQNPEVQIPPSSTRYIAVSLSSTGTFSGNVTLSVNGLPAGVVAKPVNVNLNGYSSTQIELTSDATLKPGTYPLTVSAQSGDRSAKGSVALTVPKPTVTVSLHNSYESQAVYQGDKGFVEVDVRSQDGFNGTTTLEITGLPQGVTATPTHVQVAPNTVTTVKVPLTAVVDAALGSTQVQITSPDLGALPYTGSNTFTLTVRPTRTALGANVSSQAVAASQGVWVTSSEYDSQQSLNVSTLRRLVAGKVVATASIPDTIVRLIALPSGSLLATTSPHGSGKAYLVTASGTSTPLTPPSAVDNGASDSHGRIWFVKTTQTGMGGQLTALTHWNPTTGAVATVPTAQTIEASGTFTASNDGKQLIYLPSYSNKGLKIDTVTDTVTPLEFGASAQSTSIAIRNDGLIYLTEYGRLKRINTDGSTTTFQNQSQIGRMIGFDKKDSTVLWSTSYNGLLKIDVTTNQFTELSLGSPAAATPLSSGGVAVLTQEYTSGGQIATYLSLLP